MNVGILTNTSKMDIESGDIDLYELFCHTIENYNLLEGIKNIVFLFSGGKDATFGLYMLNRYIKQNNLDINLRAVMVTYPLHVYFEDGREAECFSQTKNFWSSLGVTVEVFVSKAADLTKDSVDGCKICKSARKEIVDEYLNNVPKDRKTAIVTGYTLYDVLAYMDEYGLVSNYSYSVSTISSSKIKSRVNNCLHKIKIKEELPNGLRLIRPLVTFKENDILKYIKENQIPYTSRPCIVSSYKHKRAYFGVLNLVADINNANYEGVLNFLERNGVEFPETFDDIPMENYFTDC